MLRTSRTLEAYTSAVMALRRSRVPPELSISAGTATAAAASQKPLCSEDLLLLSSQVNECSNTNAPIRARVFAEYYYYYYLLIQVSAESSHTLYYTHIIVCVRARVVRQS